MVSENTAEIHTRITSSKFNSFSGVFVPSTLAILGAVMYYIAPHVLGGVGIVRMLAIILIAHSITIASAYSISGIATNIQVKGGGLYYLISRSLGREFGGSTGIMLYLAQTIASAFYAIAFSRAVVGILLRVGIEVKEVYITIIAYVLFFFIVFRGAKFVIHIQYAILAAIMLSLISIFMGPNMVDVENQLVNFVPQIGFWVAFAMFFPAVTGIDAGVGMSGDLKDPKKSLVIGTFGSIIFTMIIYIALAVKLSYSATPETLFNDKYIIESIAIFSPLVLLGVLMATSSSALSCMMTAPRSLRAMIKDKIFPDWLRWLGNPIGENKSEPRVALMLSAVIGLIIISVGKLEVVSQVVSMFFLSVYGWINGAAFFEKISMNASYRPSFNSPAVISLYGMVICYAVMFLFNPYVMIGVITFQFVMFKILLMKRRSVRFEGVWDGVRFELLRKILNKIENAEKSKKNYRPTIVSFCTNEINKTPIAMMVDWISANRSITKMYYLVKGKLKNRLKQRAEEEEELKEYIKEHELQLFPKVVVTKDYLSTVRDIVQSESIGNLPLNTVLVDFSEEVNLSKFVPEAVHLKKNVIILRNQAGFSEYKMVDVWWNTTENGNFMILLAYLITHSKQWKEEDAEIRLFKVIDTDNKYDETYEHLRNTIEEARIENISVEVIVSKEKLHKIINKRSKNSDLVLLGIPHFKTHRSGKEIIKNIKQYTQNIKTSLIVQANDKIDLRVS